MTLSSLLNIIEHISNKVDSNLKNLVVKNECKQLRIIPSLSRRILVKAFAWSVACLLKKTEEKYNSIKTLDKY